MVKMFRNCCYIFLFILIASISASCSKQQPTSKTLITIVGFMGGSTFTGGVMVWGKSASGKTFALSMSSEADNKSVQLSAESWHFFGVGWLGATPLAGAVKCGSTDQVLSEAQTSVALTLNDANCSQSDFATTDFVSNSNSFLPLKFVNCLDITTKIAGQNCDDMKGGAASYQITFHDLLNDVIVDSGLTSACQDESDTTSLTTTSFLIPVAAVGVSIETFPQTKCAGAKTTFSFDNGLINGATDALLFSNASYAELFLQVAIQPPLITGYSEDPANYTQNISISKNTPMNSGGAVTSWSIWPYLPTGLTLDPNLGEITGSAYVESPATTYTITATNSAGSYNFDLVITILPQPPIVSGYPDPSSFIQGVEISPIYPSVIGGLATSFSIWPGLPAGLSFNTSTGDISGIPTVTSPSTPYTVTASNAAGSSQQTNIDIEVLAPALLSIDRGPTYNYGVKAYGSNTDMTFTISNPAGFADATGLTDGGGLSAPYSFKGGVFPGTGGTCTTSLTSGSNCTIVVSFNPPSSGPYPATITIGYYDGVAAQNATRAVTGTGALPATLTIDSGVPYDFGPVVNGSSVDYTFTIIHTGGVDATSVSGTGLAAPFMFKGGTYPGTGGTCGLIINGSCTIVVTFSPFTSGLASDSIDLSYDDGVGVVSAFGNMQGTGVTPALLSLSSANFPPMTVGLFSASIPITVTNLGETAANGLSHSNFGGDPAFSYNISGVFPGSGATCGTSLPASSSCTIEVVFSPSEVRYTSGTIVLNYNNGITFQTASGTMDGNGLRPFFGTAGDGDVSISTVNTDFTTVTLLSGKKATAIAKIANVSGSLFNLNGPFTINEFDVGDEIMWIVSQAGSGSTTCGGRQGMYGFSNITGRTSTSITISGTLTFTPDTTELGQASNISTFCSMQVVKVPNLNNLTINAASDTFVPAFNSLTGVGGVFAVRLAGTFIVNGQINMTGKGYAGGSGNGSSGAKGHSETGSGALSNSIDATNNSMGGANGVYTSNGAAGGGGYAAGGNGAGTSTGGLGGSAQNYCTGPCLPSQRLFMGGGGGANTATARGGAGGGIVYIVANAIDGSGLVKAYGDPGVNDAWSGGGGGGGGSIYIKGDTLGTGPWTARSKGGAGGSAPFAGGGGGGGAAELIYCTTDNVSLIIDVIGGTSAGTGGTIVPVSGTAGFGPSPTIGSCP